MEQLPFAPGKIWLGRSAENAPIGVGDDRHVLLVAGSRSGKGTTHILPNLLTWPGSIVVIDPKGENATIAALRRGTGSTHSEGMGQRVYVLDPFREARNIPDNLRASYNPLDALDPDDPETVDEAGRIAEAIVVSTDTKDTYFDDQARYLVRSLILHVVTSKLYEGRRNLVTVRDLVARGDAQLLEEIGEAGGEVSGHQMLFSAMTQNTAFFGVIAAAGSAFETLLRSDKGWSSVHSTATNQTAFIDSRGMHEVLEKTSAGFALSHLKTDPKGVSLFLSLPQRHMPTHFRWLRMMTSLVITEMERTKGRPASGHRVLVCLDEFAGLKRMEVVEHAAAQIAGAGVKLFLVVQNLAQLKTIYQDNWETFVGNAGTQLFYGTDDAFTREYLSKYLGETEVLRTTTSESESRGTSRSTTHGTSDNSQTSYSRGTGTSSSAGKGTNDSANFSPGLFWERQTGTGSGSNLSTSKGVSSNEGWSTSTSYGTSESETYGTNEGRTAGRSQSVHKRALLTPDEIGLLFSRIDDDTSPAYPGLVLTLIAGRSPIILRRTNYHQDPAFEGKFEPHPDHEFAPPRNVQAAPSTMPALPSPRMPGRIRAAFLLLGALAGVAAAMIVAGNWSTLFPAPQPRVVVADVKTAQEVDGGLQMPSVSAYADSEMKNFVGFIMDGECVLLLAEAGPSAHVRINDGKGSSSYYVAAASLAPTTIAEDACIGSVFRLGQ